MEKVNSIKYVFNFQNGWEKDYENLVGTGGMTGEWIRLRKNT